MSNHIRFRKIEHPQACAISATETSCGLGFGDFCRFAEMAPHGCRCTLFTAPLAVTGENKKPDDVSREVYRQALRTGKSLTHRLVIGAVLGFGPIVNRCTACLAADRGEIDLEQARQLMELERARN